MYVSSERKTHVGQKSVQFRDEEGMVPPSGTVLTLSKWRLMQHQQHLEPTASIKKLQCPDRDKAYLLPVLDSVPWLCKHCVLCHVHPGHDMLVLNRE